MRPRVVAPIIVLALVAFFGYKVFNHYHARATRLRDAIQHERVLEDRRVQLERSLGLVEAYRTRLAPEAEATWLLQEVSHVATEAGVNLSSASPHKPRQLDQFPQLSVELHFTSSYHQLGQFVSRLEAAEPFLWVDELTLRLRDPESQDPQADVELVVSTLYMPPMEL